MARKFDVDQLRLQIEATLAAFPDLADDPILRADMLDGETDMVSVLTELFHACDDNKMMVQAVTTRINELGARRARLARRVEFLRELMLSILQAADLPSVVLAEATLSQRAVPPQVIGEVNADDLPDDLVRIKREPDRTAIREALLARRQLTGLYLSNSPPTLVINAK